MDVAIAKLNRGGWVHIFPEGSRSRDGGSTMGSIKRGIARLGSHFLLYAYCLRPNLIFLLGVVRDWVWYDSVRSDSISNYQTRVEPTKQLGKGSLV